MSGFRVITAKFARHRKLIQTSVFLWCVLFVLYICSLDAQETEGDQAAAPPTASSAITHMAYTLNLRRLIDQARRNIVKVDEEIKTRDVVKRNEKRELLIREYFDRGSQLYERGELMSAKKEWEKLVEVARHHEMRTYIKRSAKKEKDDRWKAVLTEQEKRMEQQKTAPPEIVLPPAMPVVPLAIILGPDKFKMIQKAMDQVETQKQVEIYLRESSKEIRHREPAAADIFIPVPRQEAKRAPSALEKATRDRQLNRLESVDNELDGIERETLKHRQTDNRGDSDWWY